MSDPTSDGSTPNGDVTRQPGSTDRADKAAGPPPPPGAKGVGTNDPAKKKSPPAPTKDDRKAAASRQPEARASGKTASDAGGEGAKEPSKPVTSKKTAPGADTKVDPAKKDEPAKAKEPAKKAELAAKPGRSGSKRPPMTAADYARTTTGDPAATAVIPAVKDEPREAPAESATATDETNEVASGGARQAQLNLVHIEPWSVTKVAFVVSVALMIVSTVAVTVFWLVLNITGVWGQVNDTVNSVLSSEDSSFKIADYIGLWRLVGLSLVISGINVILMTALAAVGARLYNVAAQLVGGVQVTFSDRS